MPAEYKVEIREVKPQLLAVARGTAYRADLVKTMLGLMSTSWEYIRASGIKAGHNVAVYSGPEPLKIEAGAEVFEPFEGDGKVVCSATPGGWAATATHIGPYHLMSGAYSAIHQWSRENGRTLIGPSWEVYGHWTEDESKLRTDIYYLLKPGI
jgi:effector-binding domain-containing protein